MRYFKNQLLLIAITALVLSGCKKSGTSAPSAGVDVYAAGFEMTPDYHSMATYWKNGVANKLITDQESVSMANAVVVIDTDVYVVGTVNNVATYWKNGVAIKLTGGLQSSAGNAMAIVGNDVYVVGYTWDVSTSSPTACYWKNGVQTKLVNDSSVFSKAYTIAVKGSDIYIGGYTNSSQATYWKNGIATVLVSNNTLSSNIAAMAVNGNDLYMVGFISNSGVVVWKNGSPTVIAGSSKSSANGIAFSNNNIYLSGESSFETGCYWKDGVLNTLAFFTEVNGIAVNGNDIYLTGDSYASGQPQPAATYWKNGNVVTLSPNATTTSITLVPKSQ